MKEILNKKIFKIVQIIVMMVILSFATMELYKIFVGIDIELLNSYSDKLTLKNIIIIIFLGILSYVPLSFYDLVLKDRIGINLTKRKLYKYSWIASSVSNLVGFAGTSAVFLKNHFYKNHVKDQSKLIKETLKVVGLNLSGFSTVCLIYTFWNIMNGTGFGVVEFGALLIGLYIIGAVIFLAYRYRKTDDREGFIISLKIIATSILEWATTVLLIYGLIKILDINVSLGEFFPIYVAAIIVAMISMVPSGVGTFDLTLLVGLNKFGVPNEQVLLLIILYRLSYYIIPVLIGAGLYIHELYGNINGEARDLISRIQSKISHFVLAILILIYGLSLVFWENIDLDRYFPIKDTIMHMDSLKFAVCLSIVTGFILIVLSTIIHTKNKYVYYIMVFVVSIITLSSLIGKWGDGELLFLGVIWLLIILSRKRFFRRGLIFTFKNAIKTTLLIGITLIVYLTIQYINVKEYMVNDRYTGTVNVVVSEFYEEGIVGSAFCGSGIAVLLVVIMLYTNRYNKFPKEMLDADNLMHIINTYGGSRLIHYAFLDDKYIYTNTKNDVIFQYQMSGDMIVVIGNPVGNRVSFFDAIQEFYELADLYGYTLFFCDVDMDIAVELHDMGYEFMKLGQDAYVELETFSLEGGKNKSRRQAINRIAKAGYKFEIVKPPFTDALYKEFEDVSDEWLGGRNEKGVFIGFLDRDYIEKAEVATIRDPEGKLKGFATIMPMYDNETLSIDLMRFKTIELNGIMDYTLANLFAYGKEVNLKYFNLGLAPLADVGRTKHSFFREKIAYQIFAYGNFIHSFKGLKHFKDKYATIWEDRYVAYRKGSSIILNMIQLIIVLSREKCKIDRKKNL